jgi:hypothetical protein
MAAARDQEMGDEGLGPGMGDCLDLGWLFWGLGWGFWDVLTRGGIGWRGCGEAVEKGGWRRGLI